MIYNSFKLDLQRSLGHEPFWDATYKKAFPSMVGHCFHENPYMQNIGIDRTLTLPNGRLIHIEEKIRYEIYSDILLEYVSDSVRKTPGWMEKDLRCDYLAYAFAPNKRAYLFPWATLKKVWIENQGMFFAEYPIIEAPNNGYSTLCVAIPIAELTTLVSNVIEIQV